MKVLLVDDDDAALKIRKLLLERHGHEVTLANDPPSARVALATANSEVVVTDLRLPEASDGLYLIRDLREAAPNLKIIVLCGNAADIEGREEAKLVDRILVKPVRSEALLKAIEEPN